MAPIPMQTVLRLLCGRSMGKEAQEERQQQQQQQQQLAGVQYEGGERGARLNLRYPRYFRPRFEEKPNNNNKKRSSPLRRLTCSRRLGRTRSCILRIGGTRVIHPPHAHTAIAMGHAQSNRFAIPTTGRTC